jgi:hypothetical protein
VMYPMHPGRRQIQENAALEAYAVIKWRPALIES